MANLIVYYSRKGENYWAGDIKVLQKGNTERVAEFVQEAVGGDLFEIETAREYDASYMKCIEEAKAELQQNARPELKRYLEDAGLDIDDYDTIFLGYPIWWGELPMCVYTFLEAHDWAGKEIRPFCTHAGSGLAGTVESIQKSCAGASVSAGLPIAGTTAQNSREEARSAVDAWVG